MVILENSILKESAYSMIITLSGFRVLKIVKKPLKKEIIL